MSYSNERKSRELLDGFQFTTATLEAQNLGNKDFLDFFSSLKISIVRSKQPQSFWF